MKIKCEYTRTKKNIEIGRTDLYEKISKLEEQICTKKNRNWKNRFVRKKIEIGRIDSYEKRSKLKSKFVRKRLKLEFRGPKNCTKISRFKNRTKIPRFEIVRESSHRHRTDVRQNRADK